MSEEPERSGVRLGGPKPTSVLLVRPDPQDELGIYSMWVGAGGSYIIHWGDGSSDPMTAVRPPKRHVYDAAGAYRVRAVRQDGHHDIARDITIPFDPTPPPPVWQPEFRAGQLSMAVRWPEGGPSGTWRIDWPDWDPEELTPVPGEWVERPALPGKHTLHVVHVASGDGFDSPQLTVTDKPWSVTFDLRLDGRTVTVRRTGPQVEAERPWWVFFGDEWSFGQGSIARQSTGLVNDQASHTYTKPGVYMVEVASSYRGLVYVGVKEVTIP